MAVNYDEKILSTFGKRTVKSASPEEPDTIEDGVFVVDPNKIVTQDDTIIPRYVKQEDLVMYANITARLNPDNAIIDDGGESTKTITIGSVGVNFLNPLAKAPKDNLGNVQFGSKKNKDYFTTEWADYFTSNADQGSFFDPETFGISNIDVTHNASLTPIIRVEFIDVQGRTLLERGDDPGNPYNIFYRFPYPLFTLTIKGYFGKAIEYPLSMTKTSMPASMRASERAKPSSPTLLAAATRRRPLESLQALGFSTVFSMSFTVRSPTQRPAPSTTNSFSMRRSWSRRLAASRLTGS